METPKFNFPGVTSEVPEEIPASHWANKRRWAERVRDDGIFQIFVLNVFFALGWGLLIFHIFWEMVSNSCN